MSYLPYEDLFDLLAESDQNGTSENMDDDAASADESSSPELGGTTILSSRGSDPGMSLNNDDSLSVGSEDTLNLQDFGGSVVSLPHGTLGGEHNGNLDDVTIGESTIVSSAPSDTAGIPVPEASSDVFILSPHPGFVPDNFQTLSTVCTDTLSYQRMMQDLDAQSPTPSMAAVGTENDDNDHDIQDDSDNKLVANRVPTHERVTFEAIANQMLRDSSVVSTGGRSSGRRRGGGEKWYSRFTDFDWDQLREAARMALAILGPTNERVPLPPSPPPLSIAGSEVADIYDSGLDCSYTASEFLPACYVCFCCKDVLVGALSLSCGCTVCGTCWEGAETISPSYVAEAEGFVWVYKRRCPACNEPVNATVPCHALDLVVLQAVKNLDVRQDVKGRQLKYTYYTRLEDWRQTVMAKNEIIAQNEAMERDELLARLIEEEEDALWSEGRTQEQAMSNSTWTLLVIGQAAVALVAATVTSLALKAFVRR